MSVEYKVRAGQYRTMFALWCLAKSPLMLGTDLRDLSVDSEAYRSLSITLY